MFHMVVVFLDQDASGTRFAVLDHIIVVSVVSKLETLQGILS